MTETSEFQQLLRSLLIGGGAAGVLSIVPLINLLNLVFMGWILIGAALSVYLFCKYKPHPTVGDALILGAGSGFVGGGLFALLGAWSILHLDEERLNQIVERAAAILPSFSEEIQPWVQNPHFKAWMLLALCAFVLAATLAGAASGLVSRLIFRQRE